MDIGDNPANKIKIIKDGLSTHIYIDGKEIPRITNYYLSQSIGELPNLELNMIPDIKQIEIDGIVTYKYFDLDGTELIKDSEEYTTQQKKGDK